LFLKIEYGMYNMSIQKTDDGLIYPIPQGVADNEVLDALENVSILFDLSFVVSILMIKMKNKLEEVLKGNKFKVILGMGSGCYTVIVFNVPNEKIASVISEIIYDINDKNLVLMNRKKDYVLVDVMIKSQDTTKIYHKEKYQQWIPI